MDTTCLHALLDDNLARAPEHPSGNTNHIPMALQALAALGAGANRMRRFAAEQAVGLDVLPASADEFPTIDWRLLRGRPDAFNRLRMAFAQDFDSNGEEAVLRRVLPELTSDVGAAAFHGPIRTAHAIHSAHRGELAAALAYWASRWRPLPAPPATADRMPFDAWADRLTRMALAAPLSSRQRSITGRMVDAAATAPYQSLAGALQASPDDAACMAHWAIDRYITTRDFTVLHLVTGLRALRILSAWATLPHDAVAPVLTAAFLASGQSQATPANELPNLSWDALRRNAIASDDPHTIKFVQACIDGAAEFDERRYRLAATLAIAH